MHYLQGRWGDAALKLAEVLNDDTFRSMEGKSKHTLWLELCDIITKHPKEVGGPRLLGGRSILEPALCIVVYIGYIPLVTPLF